MCLSDAVHLDCLVLEAKTNMINIDSKNIQIRTSKTPVSFSINRDTLRQLVEIQEAIKLEQTRYISRTAIVEFAVNELYNNIHTADDLTPINYVGGGLE